MTSPTTRVPMLVELAFDANLTDRPGNWLWTDITDRTRILDDSTRAVEYSTGRRDESDRADSGSCTVRLDNRDGRFSSRNPHGPYYGRLYRNMPIRVRLNPIGDSFTRTVTNAWGTSTTGHSWSNAGAGGTVSASDWQVNGGQGRHFVPAGGAFRFSWLPQVQLIDCEVRFRVTVPITNVTGGPIEPGGVMLRMQDINTYYLVRMEVTAAEVVTLALYGPSGPLATATVPYSWSGQPFEVRAGISGNRLMAKAWDSSVSDEPSGWHVEASNDELLHPGGIGIRSGVHVSNTNTKPIEFRYDNLQVYVDRFSGFVNSWPTRWDQTGNDSVVEISASGIISRLLQGTPPAKSPIRRAIEATNPLAYWPGEDGVTSNRIGSTTSETPLSVRGAVEYVSIDDYVGSTATLRYGTSSVINLASGAALFGTLSVPATQATASEWTVSIRADINPANFSGNYVLAQWLTPGGTFIRWQIVITPTDSRLIGYDGDLTPTTLITSELPFGLSEWAVSAKQNEGFFDIGFRTTDLEATYTSGTLTGITNIQINPTRVVGTAPIPVGHIAIWPTFTNPLPFGDTVTDMYGEEHLTYGLSNRYEPATVRLGRLCAEDGVELYMPEPAKRYVTRMGWQPIAQSIELYRQCETADQGFLYEQVFGLGYMARQFRYNRPYAMFLDFAQGHVAEPPEPTDDDQQLRNRWTAKRIDGSSVQVEKQSSIEASGLYEGSVDVSISAGIQSADDDRPLFDFAAFRLHQTTNDDLRWPVIKLNIRGTPELVYQWLSCRVGSRISIANPPSQVSGGTIDLIIEGYKEILGTYEWRVEMNCSPATPWNVFVLGDSVFGRLDTTGSELAMAVDETATSLLVATDPGKQRWTTSAERPSDFPFAIQMGGEVIKVEAISNTVSPQTFTVTRSVNGIEKAHTPGTRIQLAPVEV